MNQEPMTLADSHPVVRRTIRERFENGTLCIHGKVYDITHFKHPGGQTWIDLAEGTDATVLFESSHLNGRAASKLLETLPVVGGSSPCPVDFGSYRKVRDSVLSAFPERGMRGPTLRAELKFAAYATSAALAHAALLSCRTLGGAWLVAVAASACLNTIVGSFGHNFLHRLDARALGLDWNGLSSYEWLLEHVQSHHPQPNSSADHDAISMLPFVRWGNWGEELRAWRVFAQTIAIVPLFAIAEVAVALQGMLVHRCRWKVPAHFPAFLRHAPWIFVARVASHFVAQPWPVGCASLLAAMVLASLYFSWMAHLNHAVAGPCSDDFVKQQLSQTVDCRPIGDLSLGLDRQTLHHLFPTLDHSRLDGALRTRIKRRLGCDRVCLDPLSLAELNALMFSRVGGKRDRSRSEARHDLVKD